MIPASDELDSSLAGMSIQRRMEGWPKPTIFITVLRDPVWRFISILRYAHHWKKYNTFWEGGPWNEDAIDITQFDHVVNKYSELRSEWRRSQFTETLNHEDYGGLEYLVAPRHYDDIYDPLANTIPLRKNLKKSLSTP